MPYSLALPRIPRLGPAGHRAGLRRPPSPRAATPERAAASRGQRAARPGGARHHLPRRRRARHRSRRAGQRAVPHRRRARRAALRARAGDDRVHPDRPDAGRAGHASRPKCGCRSTTTTSTCRRACTTATWSTWSPPRCGATAASSSRATTSSSFMLDPFYDRRNGLVVHHQPDRRAQRFAGDQRAAVHPGLEPGVGGEDRPVRRRLDDGSAPSRSSRSATARARRRCGASTPCASSARRTSDRC